MNIPRMVRDMTCGIVVMAGDRQWSKHRHPAAGQFTACCGPVAASCLAEDPCNRRNAPGHSPAADAFLRPSVYGKERSSPGSLQVSTPMQHPSLKPGPLFAQGYLGSRAPQISGPQALRATPPQMLVLLSIRSCGLGRQSSIRVSLGSMRSRPSKNRATSAWLRAVNC